MSVRVLLVDDHGVMREGLRALLERSPAISAVSEADNGRAAMEMVPVFRPEIVVMDVGLPELNGIEATRKIRVQFPEIHVVALSMYADRRYVLGMLEAGAAAYVLKGAAAAQLIQAIEAVAKGGRYLSPEIAGLVVDGCLNHQDPDHHPKSSGLGNREKEVLQLLAEGYSSKQIATKLGISSVTVETHRRNIMKKLELHSIAQLTKYAIREGLTGIDQ
jgi:two-component system, NarL family, response regulator LiaR